MTKTNNKKRALTEKQVAALIANRKPMTEEIRKMGVAASVKARQQRLQWRLKKRYQVAKKLSVSVLMGEDCFILTGYETENDLKRAENDVKRIVSGVLNRLNLILWSLHVDIDGEGRRNENETEKERENEKQ